MKAPPGDVGPQITTRVATSSQGRGENFEGRKQRGGAAVSQTAQNTADLMVGSTLQHMCGVGEEKNVRAVGNRGDGTWTNGGSVRPEVTAAMSPREWTLQQVYDGEAIFGNPQERHLTAARKVTLEAEMVASEKVTRSAGGS